MSRPTSGRSALTRRRSAPWIGAQTGLIVGVVFAAIFAVAGIAGAVMFRLRDPEGYAGIGDAFIWSVVGLVVGIVLGGAVGTLTGAIHGGIVAVTRRLAIPALLRHLVSLVIAAGIGMLALSVLIDRTFGAHSGWFVWAACGTAVVLGTIILGIRTRPEGPGFRPPSG